MTTNIKTITGKTGIKIDFKKAHTKTKEFAFMKAHELNNIEKPKKKTCDFCNGKRTIRPSHIDGTPFIDCPQCKGYGHYYEKVVWRVGKNSKTQLVIDIDGHDKNNLKTVVQNLHIIFQYEFNIIKTKHGYHIIGNKKYPLEYKDTNNTGKDIASSDWYHANCLVLNPLISKAEYPNFMHQLIEMDDKLKDYQGTGRFNELYIAALKGTGLLNPIGDIDIGYNVLCMKYGEVTLRISKKDDNDRYDEIKLEEI